MSIGWRRHLELYSDLLKTPTHIRDTYAITTFYQKFLELNSLKTKSKFEHLEIKNRLIKVINCLDNIFKIIKCEEKINRSLKVVITGKPNVGKSTLLNRLSKNKVAIVTKYAGTTRDLVKSKININGNLIEIVDTAGIHKSKDIIEKYGIKIAKNELQKSDIILKIYSAEEYILEKKKDR